jgi:hypothetical protein
VNPHNPSLAAVRPQDQSSSRRASFNRHETADAASLGGDFSHAARFICRQPLVIDRQLALEAESSTPARAAHRLNSI